MKASFDGEIPEIPGISVDNFEAPNKRAYFLSHCHSDHTTGLKYLYPALREAGNVFIYMSEPSAAIVETHINQNLKEFVRPLRLGKPITITIPGDEINNIEEMYVTVTLSPAGHCFGSVMFLFETTLKKILYTGDFRVSENLATNLAFIHDENGKPIKLDVLYVDTTFQNDKYTEFPKRTETIDYVVREIEDWLGGEENHVALVASARYGYEYVLNEIYKRMGVKVFVSDQSNGELYRKFPELLPGVTNKQDYTKIHLCSNSRKYCVACQTPRNYLYIKFSAMRYQGFKSEDLFVHRLEDSMFVCFATHCSRSELTYFVGYLAPKKVVGFPNEYVPVKRPSDITPTKIFTPKRSAEKKDGSTPKKVPKSVLKNIFG